jgi:1-acyl-sn-glycerol-3-phosphate acyltransferase
MSSWLLILRAATLAFVILACFLFSLRWWAQSLVRALLVPRYRLRVIGREHIPPSGPVLIAANHVTWLDGFFLAAACPRRGHALVNAAYIDWPVIGLWARWIGLIPVHYSGPRAQRALFKACRQVLDRGEVLGLFPEAQMTRNGLTGPFYRGLELIVAGRENVAVVPMFLENLWGSTFSYAAERSSGRRLGGARRCVIAVFGPPMAPPVTAFAVRQAVLEAGVTACEHRGSPAPPLETIDPGLPHLEHPELGPLTGSTANHDHDGIRQTGHKPETLGCPLPCVALRVVNDLGGILPTETAGRVLARLPWRQWTDTGYRGSLDRDGFLRLLP